MLCSLIRLCNKQSVPMSWSIQEYWDPTGRYFVTCSTLGGRMGADFKGRGLCRKALERLFQFKWRPRPSVKLSEQKSEEIKNNLKKTAVCFEREDNEERNRASQEVVEKRRKIMAAFDVIRQRNLKKIAGQKDGCLAASGCSIFANALFPSIFRLNLS